ncbi:MAG: flagellar biosynthetic protein FliO [Acidobacteria bacterium]|nr:flagellar biosynthetic protein FliO [Acidobacteriota bacterium]
MRTYCLTFALLAGIATSSALAQATGETTPKKLITEVSSTTHQETKAVKTKSSAESTGKPKSSTASQSTPEPKTSTAPPLGSSPVPETKAPQTEERLPFKLNDRPESVPEPPSITGLLLRTFGALLFIVGLIAAAGWGLRYFGIINFGKPASETAGLQILNTVPLGEKRSLTIVKFGERTLLIGSTPQGLTLLAEQQDDVLAGNNFSQPLRTVTDFLEVGPTPQFEDEMAHATFGNNPWQHRRVQ